MHTAKARNWNGQLITVDFKSSGNQKQLAAKARAAIERKGYTTYQLVEIDGEKLPVELQY